jgi:hypothetical protein
MKILIRYWVFRLFYRRFDQVWIPDFPPPPNLSGELSHRKTRQKNVCFIGPRGRTRIADCLDW